MALCDTCVIALEHPHFRFPTHLVHPEHGKPMVWSIAGEAVCPDCGATWRSNCDNTVELLP